MMGAIGTKTEFKNLSRSERRRYERAALKIGAPKEAAEDEQFRKEVDRLDEQTAALATEFRAAMEHDVRLRVEKRAYDEATRDTKRTYDELVRAKKNVKETKVTPTPEVGEKEGKTDGVENS